MLKRSKEARRQTSCKCSNNSLRNTFGHWHFWYQYVLWATKCQWTWILSSPFVSVSKIYSLLQLSRYKNLLFSRLKKFFYWKTLLQIKTSVSLEHVSMFELCRDYYNIWNSQNLYEFKRSYTINYISHL